ncbi:HutD family protein [Nakamurella antarctica]|uniref:HutD family protein n=1 Tax=Nakamurella antarctica TaxID=1902245 RepID=A0A3G8ZMX2_9ACTN|nr:HutD family protein [Nakamurella antarctica]AZI58603.1 HutD family protein [Nakamurella antarctica]
MRADSSPEPILLPANVAGAGTGAGPSAVAGAGDSLLHLPARSRTVTAWKNGGGQTWQIAADSPQAAVDNFAWRVSIACISKDGIFSAFPGVDRSLGLIDGDDLELLIEGELRRLRRGTVTDFAGEANVVGRLTGSATRDLNLMVRRSFGRGSMEFARVPVGTSSIVGQSAGFTAGAGITAILGFTASAGRLGESVSTSGAEVADTDQDSGQDLMRASGLIVGRSSDSPTTPGREVFDNASITMLVCTVGRVTVRQENGALSVELLPEDAVLLGAGVSAVVVGPAGQDTADNEIAVIRITPHHSRGALPPADQ